MLLDFCIFCIVKSFCSLQQSSFESSIYLDTESALQIQYNIILSTPDIFHFEDVHVFFGTSNWTSLSPQAGSGTLRTDLATSNSIRTSQP